jgi:hypothetical protein
MFDLSRYDGYTPGPWTDGNHGEPKHVSYGDYYNDIWEESDGEQIKFIVKSDSGAYGPYGADRKLIIDAPKILEELRRVYKICLDAGIEV